MNFKIVLFIFCLGIFAGCGESKKKEPKAEMPELNGQRSSFPVEVKHASRFKIEEQEGFTVVTVINPWQGADQDYVYVLVSDGQEKPQPDNFRQNKSDIVQLVEIPLESMVLTSTTYVSLLDQLGETATLKGFPGTDHISSEKARKLIDAGKVQNLGTEAQLNIEKLIALNPDALMDYASQGENKSAQLARKAGIPVLYNADFLENTPLGRAEWLKFAAAFFNKSEMADSLFRVLENNYDSLRTLAAQATDKPSVYSGIVYGDTWFLPGGQNAGAQFLKDAQADYLWENTPEEGSIKLSFEAVFAKAHNADFWIGAAAFNSLQEIKNADERYSNFKAFKEGNVFTYNAKKGAKGGLLFFELGYSRPDLILADHIKILHPELLPDYDLYFYKRLE